VSLYYEDDLVTLYHGDSREFLPTLADQSVDCVITDPPYSEATSSPPPAWPSSAPPRSPPS
jgi:DNA modification methylase